MFFPLLYSDISLIIKISIFCVKHILKLHNVAKIITISIIHSFNLRYYLTWLYLEFYRKSLLSRPISCHSLSLSRLFVPLSPFLLPLSLSLSYLSLLFHRLYHFMFTFQDFPIIEFICHDRDIQLHQWRN